MKKIIIAATVVSLLAVYSCKEKEAEHAEEHESSEHHESAGMKPMTKVVKTDGIQVAFDLMSMEQHQKMMKMMNSTMSHGEKSNHAIMLTILDQASMKPIKGAEVDVTMTEDGGHAHTKKAMVAEGNGMYHYAVDYEMHSKAGCKVVASIKANGKTYNAEASFIMKH